MNLVCFIKKMCDDCMMSEGGENADDKKMVRLDTFREEKKLSEEEARQVAQHITSDEYSSEEALVADFKTRDALDRDKRDDRSDPMTEDQIRARVATLLENARAGAAAYNEQELLTILSHHVKNPTNFHKTYILPMAEAYLKLQDQK